METKYKLLKDYLTYDIAHEKYVQRNMNCRMIADEIIAELNSGAIHISRYSNNRQYFDKGGKPRNQDQLKESLSRAIFRLVRSTYGFPKQAHPKRRCTNGIPSLRENIRKEQLKQEGWIVLSKGWPDFLKYKRTKGKLIVRAEELKHDSQARLDNLGLTKEQKKTLFILSKLIPIDIVHMDKDGNIDKTTFDNEIRKKTRNNKTPTLEETISKLEYENEQLRLLLFLARINNADLTQQKDIMNGPTKEDSLFHRQLGKLAFESRHNARAGV